MGSRSWSDAFKRLCDSSVLRPDEKVYKFLSSDEAIHSLATSLQGRDQATQQSKSDFDTRTAAINITPTANGQYDIEQTKRDALWLASQAGLDEISALRHVVLEWQHRPQTRLRSGFTEAERATMESLVGSGNAAVSGQAGREFEIIHSIDQLDTDPLRFLSDERRHLRIIDEYFSERISILAIHEILIGAAFEGRKQTEEDLFSLRGKGSGGGVQPLAALGQLLLDKQKENPGYSGVSHIEKCVKRLRISVGNLDSGSGILKAEGGREDIEDAWTRVNLQEMIHILNIMFLHVRSCKRIFPAPLVLEWFRFAAEFDFLERFQPSSEAQTALIPALRACVVSVSLSLLQLSASMSTLLDISGKTRGELEAHHLSMYFLDKSNISELHDIFLSAAGNLLPVASPAVFAWGTLLYAIREVGLIAKETRESGHLIKGQEPPLPSGPQALRRNSGSSIGSIQQSIYEDAFDAVRHLHQDDPVGFLISSAVEGTNVFDIVSTAASIPGSRETVTAIEKQLSFQELVSASLDTVGYSPEVVTCLFEILNDTTSPGSSLQKTIPAAFVQDKTLMEAVFEESLSRFPYESLPFLKLCASLANVRDDNGTPYILSRLSAMDTFTQATAPDFNGFHTIREDENANLVSLDQELTMDARQGQLLLGSGSMCSAPASSDMFLIKSGTTGQVVSDSRPLVVMWYHRYSGLSFIGKILKLCKNGEEVSFATPNTPSHVIINASVTLLSRLVTSCTASHKQKTQPALNLAKSVLEDASDALERNEDIVSVIFELFEQELNDLRYRSAADRNLDVLTACIHFFRSTIPVLPGRVWPLLAKSALLDLDGTGGLLASVVGSLESSSGYYFFLQSCVELYQALVDEASALSPAAVTSDSPGRMSEKSSLASSAPAHVVGRVLQVFTQAVAEMFVSTIDWRFMIPQQQAEIAETICSAFSKVIQFTFFVDDTSALSKKLTTALSPSATYLMEALKPDALTGTLSSPIIRSITGALHLPSMDMDVAFFRARIAETRAALKLGEDVIKSSHHLGEPLFGLETQLSHALPILIRVTGEHDRFVSLTLNLIQCLLDGSENSTTSISLLGQIGSESAKEFLSILAQHERSEEDLDTFCATWRLLTTLLSSRQQWFAVFILTGLSPKESAKARFKESTVSESSTASTSVNGKSFLESALHQLYQIETLNPRMTIPLLAFIAQAQEKWSWASSSIRNQSGFLPSLYNYVTKIDLKPNRPLQQCYEIRIAAAIANILDLVYHYLRSVGEQAFLKKAIPCLIWYTENAVAVSGYNSSLHSNLKRNLDRKYPFSKLSNFKKTSAATRELGEDYYYDVDIAKRILAHDTAWVGNKDRGFEHELRRANANLSLVESQLLLLRSWRAFTTDHCALFFTDAELQKPLASTAKKCLVANTTVYPQEAIFDEVFQVRADLVLTLMQRTVAVNWQEAESEAPDLLSKAWDTIRFRAPTFDTALANDDLHYWRTLSEIVFLTLRLLTRIKPHEQSSKLLPMKSTTLSTIFEILTTLVAQGFKGMTSVLHDDTIAPDTITPKDFGLILGILQTCLQIPSIPRLTSELADHIISTDVAKSAVLLFSWAHTLTPPTLNGSPSDPDPIYGEISLLFLVSLSTVPPIAEYLATSSVLTQISSTHLSYLLSSRPSHHPANPFDNKSALSRRLYNIWSQTLLPLTLNLLTHVGRNFASDLAAFLNQFTTQLTAASTSLSGSSSSISLSTITELSSLSLTAFILDAYRNAGPSAGVDALDIPQLVGWDPAGRKEIREDIEDLLQRRAEIRRRLVAGSTKEAEMLRAKPKGTDAGTGTGLEAGIGTGYENQLEEKVVEELKAIVSVLKGEIGDEGGREE